MLSHSVSALARQLWDTFFSIAIRPCQLPAPAALNDEHIKINFLRIILGILSLHRTGLITFSSYYFYPPHGYLSCPPEFWFSLVILILACFFTLGLFTPIATLGLLLLYNGMDVALHTTTLGTNLYTLCLFFFLFSNAGSRLSIDAVNLKNKNSVLHLPTRILYNLINFPSGEQLRVYYWLLFAAYAALSLAAVSLHLQDEYWQKGETVALMLNNSFLCSQWKFFRGVSHEFPWLTSAFSVLSCVGQTFFQLFMLPLAYTRWGTWFVGVWGTGFCLISLALLQISWIPSIECVLWALIFCPASLIARITSKSKSNQLAGTLVLRKQSISLSLALSAASLTAFLLFAGVTLGHHYPSVGLFRKAAKYVGPRLYYVGLDVPDVFNRLDLSTDKFWYVVSRRDSEGNVTPVPITYKDGSRDFYYWFDTIYFSNFLPWRRMMGLYPGDPIEQLAPEGPCRKLIAQAVSFDRKLNRLPEDMEYQVTVYAADPSGENNDPSVLTEFSLGGTADMRLSSHFCNSSSKSGND